MDPLNSIVCLMTQDGGDAHAALTHERLILVPTKIPTVCDINGYF